MWILIINLLILSIIAATAGIIRNKRIQKKIERGELESYPEVKEIDGECCGLHEVCERYNLLASASKSVEYYDDEELDRYQGVSSDSYTRNQVEEFREVFYTMREMDVSGWNRSLQLRGINLPDELKDEVFLVVGERQFH